MNKKTYFAIKRLFDDRLHIFETIPMNIFKYRYIVFKGCLEKEKAEKILDAYLPVALYWKYKQDKRIKKFKYVGKME